MNLTPSLGEARDLARSYDVVPLYAEFIGDLETPISAVLRFAEEDTVFLLESAEAAERFGRYSFLGFDPKRTLSYRNGVFTVVDSDGVREVPAADPFRGLAEIVGQKSVAPLPNLPAFVGGAVGFFSYDAVRYLEKLPDCPARRPRRPRGPLRRHRHPRRLRSPEAQGPRRLPRRRGGPARRRGGRLRGRLPPRRRRREARRRAPRGPPRPAGARLRRRLAGGATRNFTREGYEEAVERAKEYIRAGDAFQVVPSQRFTAEVGELDPLLLYRGLRTVNPSPYMTYLKIGDLTLVGASPEPLVRVEGRQGDDPPGRRNPPEGRDARGGRGARRGAARRREGAGRARDAR